MLHLEMLTLKFFSHLVGIEKDLLTPIILRINKKVTFGLFYNVKKSMYSCHRLQ